MSINKRGAGYQVRWRDGDGRHSRTFSRWKDAEAFELLAKRRKQLGPLAPSVIECQQTLASFMEEEWWPRYAMVNLAPETRVRLLQVWGKHVLPRLGDYSLTSIDQMLLEDFRDELEKAGVGRPTQLKALHLVQAILKRAVVRRLISSNPVRDIDKPRQVRTRSAQPLAPDTVERIRLLLLEPRPVRAQLYGRGRSPHAGVTFDRRTGKWRGQATLNGRYHSLGRYDTEREAAMAVHEFRAAHPRTTDSAQSILAQRRNALIVSLIGYAGLRPAEDRSLMWEDLVGGKLRVFATKTKQERMVDLVTPLVLELAEWRMLCGRPESKTLIVPRPSGGPWAKQDWDNWRRRVWRPAAIAAGVTGDLRPYRLRGSFGSLLLWEGRSLTYVAEQLGHDVATLARYYAGTIAELEGLPTMLASEAIEQARARVRNSSLEWAEGL